MTATLRFFFFIVFLFPVSQSCFSQLDNSSLFFNSKIDTSHEEETYFKLQSLGFLKNNEYTNVMFDGYTLFGYQLNPQLGYKFSKYFAIEAGVFMAKDFGNKNYTEISPTFSLRYMKKHFKMIFGNIDGSLNHQLIEPVYNFERVLNKRMEHGLQLTLDKKHFDVDLWIDWLNMIYRGTSEQEKFVVGLNTNVLKLEKNKWEFRLPFQATVIHEGGQLDTIEKGVRTDFNYAAGIILGYKTERKYIKRVYVDARYVLRADNYYAASYVIQSWGDGFLGNIGIKGPYQSDVLLSYWYADSYYNELGGDMYSSKSRTVAYSSYYSQRLRELVILRVTKVFPLAQGVNLTLRAEPHYDIRNRDFEYSFGFYISLDETFWLKNKTKTRQSSQK